MLPDRLIHKACGGRIQIHIVPGPGSPDFDNAPAYMEQHARAAEAATLRKLAEFNDQAVRARLPPMPPGLARMRLVLIDGALHSRGGYVVGHVAPAPQGRRLYECADGSYVFSTALRSIEFDAGPGVAAHMHEHAAWMPNVLEALVNYSAPAFGVPHFSPPADARLHES